MPVELNPQNLHWFFSPHQHPREVSIASGNQVYEALDRDKYEAIRYDPKTDLPQLFQDASKIDAALIIGADATGDEWLTQGRT